MHGGQAAFRLRPKDLYDTPCDLSRFAGVRTPAISRRLVHAGLEVVVDQPATQFMDSLFVHDVRRYQEHRGAISHRFEIHEAEKIPEEGVLDEPLRPYDKALLKPGSPPEAIEHVTGLDLDREAKAKVLLDVGFEIPPLIIRHRDHHLEDPARPAQGEQFGDLGLCETAELDVAERAYDRNNAIGAAGLVNWV